ncbi:MAG: AAA family ATPase, partial [Bacteroidota bacterium]|nr:AAA family ATPase [Bacteroidota bacterium]
MENYTGRKQYIKKLLAYKDQDLIKVVTGLRRSGKSTLLQMYCNELQKLGIASNQMVSLNFEEMELHKYLNDLD